jgi:hypothetical protein
LDGAVDDGDAVGRAVLEYRLPDGGIRREPVAVCLGERFEDAEPVRQFHFEKGLRSFAGWWWFATTGCHVGFESWLERDHVMLMDFDPAVVGLSSQPFWLHWRDGAGAARRHAPDFFARRADGTALVIDVRPDDRIAGRDADAFAVTALACAAAGWQFRRVGECDQVRVANVRWLSRYRHPRCGGPEGTSGKLLEVFAQPRPLFAGAAMAGDRLRMLPAVFHLMWRQRLTADLASGLLGAGTMVRLGGPG